MTKGSTRPEADRDVLAGLRTSEDEVAALQALERSGKAAEFTRAAIALDKKEAMRGLADLEGLDQKTVNRLAYRAATDVERAAQRQIAAAALGPSLIAGLLAQQRVKCDCLVPFTFTQLRAFGAMSGPDLTDVRNGILGAIRLADDEYTVSNPGNTVGKARVSLNGQIYLSFAATLPQSGEYCLLLPAGNLWIHGHSRVVGHGNSTTSYDAKVWVYYYLLLQVGGRLLELSGGRFHYDGTRSEDRTRNFNHDLVLSPRYLFFQAHAGESVTLDFRLEANTAANEDGIAIVVVDAFGFPANTRRDYDTFAVRTS